jgi:hypothetical protein
VGNTWSSVVGIAEQFGFGSEHFFSAEEFLEFADDVVFHVTFDDSPVLKVLIM